MELILKHINSLKHDLPAGIKIDPFRIFLIGFSGGARIAVADAITNGDVAGVVGIDLTGGSFTCGVIGSRGG